MKKTELLGRINKARANQIFRLDSHGFMFSKTSIGELYLGDGIMYDPSATYMKDTPENREHLNGLFSCWSFGRELKV